jgi:putative transposase
MTRPRKPKPVSLLQPLPEIIRLTVIMYVKFPLSLRNVEDSLAERGIDNCHETVRFWWNRFGPMSPPRFAGSGLPRRGILSRSFPG